MKEQNRAYIIRLRCHEIHCHLLALH
jgi:hypothetical protein